MKLLALAIPILMVGSAGVAQPGPVTTPASAGVIQPGNVNPAHDNRGNRVLSAEAIVPDGYNGVTGSPAMGGPEEDVADVQTVPTTAAGVPACSATITDHCLETYGQTYTGPYTTH